MLMLALRRSFVTPMALAALVAASQAGDQTQSPAAPPETAVSPEPASSAAAEVDRRLTEELLHELPAGQTLAPAATDQAFLRRVYLDLVGEPPSPGEVTAFCLDPSAGKRASLVERLLADERFGGNWGRYWRDVILYRRSAEQVLFAAGSLEQFLTEQFNGRPRWNEIARAFLVAQGDIYEHGETGLFMAHLAQPAEVAAEVSRIFLGIQIQCAQCHDHPTDRWKRQQFHEFAAFFPRASLRRRPTQPPAFELTSFDAGPRLRRPALPGRGSLEHYMPDLKDPTSPGTLMAPVFFATGDQLAAGATDSERRNSLSQWLTSPANPWFARAFVNRLWAELVGEGFYEPIDDLGPDRPAAAPRTLDYLCQQFVAHGYDVKWLIETIAGTRAYQRESRPRRLPDQAPFAANVAYRLRSDQLFNAISLAVGASLESNPPAGTRVARLRGGPRQQFAQQFGYDPSVRRDEVGGTIPQTLLMMNSPLVVSRLSARGPGGVLAKLLGRGLDDESLALELYLRCLSREPNDSELAVCLDHVKVTGNRAEAFEDIFWSLLNSEEFLYRN